MRPESNLSLNQPNTSNEDFAQSIRLGIIDKAVEKSKFKKIGRSSDLEIKNQTILKWLSYF